MTSALPDSFFVGDYSVERKLNRISLNGNEQIVEPRVMELLYYLSCHAGEVISRQQIMDDVWVSQVSDGAINRVIGLLRKELADNADSPRYIQTVAKQGYCLIADVVVVKQANNSVDNAKRATIFSSKFKIVSVIVACVFILMIWTILQPTAQSTFTIYNPQFELLTSEQGFEYDPSLSKDEQWLVYRHRKSSDQPYHLYLKKRAQQHTIQLTLSVFNDRSPSFSHDKRKIIFFRKGKGTCTLNILNLDENGEPLAIEEVYQCGAVEHYSNVVWAPDNQSVYFTDRENSAMPYQIYQLNLNTFKVDEITQKEDNYYGDNELSLSPSGELLVFFRNKYWGNNQVFVKNLVSGEQRKITELGFLSWTPSWTSDEQSILFSDNRAGGKLNRLDIATGNIQTLYQSAQSINSPELSATGRHIIYATEKADVDLWQVDLTTPEWQAEKIPFNSSQIDSQPVYSHDGSALVFTSNRNGAMQLWLHKKGELTAIESLPHPIKIDSYAWHPDNKSVVVASGDKQLYLVDTVKDNTQRFNLKTQSAAFPTFSHDGRNLYFTSDKSGDWQLWSYNLTNKEVSQITQKGGYQVKSDLSTTTLYFTKYRQKGLWQLDLTTNTESLIVENIDRNTQFNVCNRSIFYLTDSDNTELWQTNLEATTNQKLMSLPLNSRFKFDLTENCQTLVFSKWDNIESDIVMMNL